jgi:hypothetical protein
MKYDLSHLTQDTSQKVIGPIQDDEALFLYSIIVGMKLKTVFEIGGLSGYSASNFLAAVGDDGRVFTVDINPVESRGHNHICIQKDAREITYADLNYSHIDLIFFDCHMYEEQMQTYHTLLNCGAINDATIIALHDTNLHYQKFLVHECVYTQTVNGYAHQPVERQMVNTFSDLGYDAFYLHTTQDKHSSQFPFRHGVTVMNKRQRL